MIPGGRYINEAGKTDKEQIEEMKRRQYKSPTVQQVWSGEYKPVIPWSLICLIWFAAAYQWTTIIMRNL